MLGGRASVGEGQGTGGGVAVWVAPGAPEEPGVGTLVAVGAGVPGQVDPGGAQGLSGVGCWPLAQGAPGGPMTLPPGVGAVNGTTLKGASADFMNFCHMVAGRVPPETSMPWTLVICGVLPVFGSVV